MSELDANDLHRDGQASDATASSGGTATEARGALSDAVSPARPAEVVEHASGATTDLIVRGALTPAVVFREGGVRSILDSLKAEVAKVDIDISTPRGRKDCASLAYKIARSKTALDEMGKTLTDQWRKQAEAVHAERRVIVKELDELAEEVRAPLTEWENTEKARVKAHEDALAQIDEQTCVWLPGATPSVEEIEAHIAKVHAVAASRDWQEFRKRASDTVARALDVLAAMLAGVRKLAEEQAEAARLQAEREEAERLRIIHEQQAREARIAAEAAEAARLEAERKAAEEAAEAERRATAERERIEAEAHAAAEEAARVAQAERDRLEAEARAAAEAAEAERQRVIREAEAQRERLERAAQAERDAAAERSRQASAALAKAERERQEAEDRAQEAAAQAERDRIAAAQRAEEEKAAAVRAEQQRVAREAAEKAEADRKRAENVAHRRSVNRQAVTAIVQAMSEEHTGDADEAERIAVAIVTAAAKGEIPHVRIEY